MRFMCLGYLVNKIPTEFAPAANVYFPPLVFFAAAAKRIKQPLDQVQRTANLVRTADLRDGSGEGPERAHCD